MWLKTLQYTGGEAVILGQLSGPQQKSTVILLGKTGVIDNKRATVILLCKTEVIHKKKSHHDTTVQKWKSKYRRYESILTE